MRVVLAIRVGLQPGDRRDECIGVSDGGSVLAHEKNGSEKRALATVMPSHVAGIVSWLAVASGERAGHGANACDCDGCQAAGRRRGGPEATDASGA